MELKEIKSFCKFCGSIFDNGRLKNCKKCKGKLTKVGDYDQTFSEFNGVYILKLNFHLGIKKKFRDDNLLKAQKRRKR